jgi:hypothetical protein
LTSLNHLISINDLFVFLCIAGILKDPVTDIDKCFAKWMESGKKSEEESSRQEDGGLKEKETEEVVEE